MAPDGTVVVVGASLAGWRSALALRTGGHTGRIVVVGAETHLPYDRPPLSKRVLTGQVEAAATDLGAGDESAGELGIDWRLGVPAAALDPDTRELTLADGAVIGFDGLVIATGSHARTLPAVAGVSGSFVAGSRVSGGNTAEETGASGAVGLDGVHFLRTLEDAVALRAALERHPRRVVVIGAGFIGLEVASSCRTLDLDVTVLEAAPVPLLRALGAEMGRRIAEWHREHGVDVRLGVTVEGLVGVGHVKGVRLRAPTDEVIAADLVLVGVGAAPTTAWLKGSGIDIEDGVLADSRLRVLADGRAVPHIVAAGDVARWQHPGSDTPVRVEHWTNAVDAAQAAAATLLGGESADEFAPVPYFWSDQLGRKLQMVGLARPDDEVAIIEATPGDPRFVAAYGRGGRLVDAPGLGRPARVMALQRAIEEGLPFPPRG